MGENSSFCDSLWERIFLAITICVKRDREVEDKGVGEGQRDLFFEASPISSISKYLV